MLGYVLPRNFSVMLMATPYSPDLAPSNFHLFSLLKQHLGGKRFKNEEQLKAEAENWLNNFMGD